MMSDYDNAQGAPRPTKPDGTPRLIAGDADLAGGNQVAKWNRNSTTHTPGPLTPSAVAQNGSKPAKSGGAHTTKR